MNWDTRVLATAQNFATTPLTIKSIRKFTSAEKNEMFDPSWPDVAWPYWVGFQEDVISSVSAISKQIPIFKNTFKDLNSDGIFYSNSDSDAFYYFVRYLGQKRIISFRGFVNSNKSGISFFLLSDTNHNSNHLKDINNIIVQEKAKWYKLGYTEEKDLITENKRFVEQGINKAQKYLGLNYPKKQRKDNEQEKKKYHPKVSKLEMSNSNLYVEGSKAIGIYCGGGSYCHLNIQKSNMEVRGVENGVEAIGIRMDNDIDVKAEKSPFDKCKAPIGWEPTCSWTDNSPLPQLGGGVAPLLPSQVSLDLNLLLVFFFFRSCRNAFKNKSSLTKTSFPTNINIGGDVNVEGGHAILGNRMRDGINLELQAQIQQANLPFNPNN